MPVAAQNERTGVVKGTYKDMGFLELLFVGIGLSMDAFSVAVCKGLQMRRIRWGRTLTVAAFFGGFQALMPLIGWLLGKQFEQYIVAIDHWVAFILLLFIGGKMILDVIKESREGKCPCEEEGQSDKDAPFHLGELAVMALATSIDALAAGVSIGLMGAPIVPSALFIGCVTFLISSAGVWIGHRFGEKYRSGAQIAGGIILILIGIRLLL